MITSLSGYCLFGHSKKPNTISKLKAQWQESNLKLFYSKAKRKRVQVVSVSPPLHSTHWLLSSWCFSFLPPTDIGLGGIIGTLLLFHTSPYEVYSYSLDSDYFHDVLIFLFVQVDDSGGRFNINWGGRICCATYLLTKLFLQSTISFVYSSSIINATLALRLVHFWLGFALVGCK